MDLQSNYDALFTKDFRARMQARKRELNARIRELEKEEREREKAEKAEAIARMLKERVAMVRSSEAFRCEMTASRPHWKSTLYRIRLRICRAMRVDIREVNGPYRNDHIVLARQAIAYWSRRQTQLSYPEIGRRLGDRDHTTILHAIRAYPQKRAKMGRYLRTLR